MSARQDGVARDFHEIVLAACQDGLTAQLAALHAPVSQAGRLVCAGCGSARPSPHEPEVSWPCSTYTVLVAAVLEVADVEAALTSLLAVRPTATQVEMLRFLAGQRPDPPQWTRSTYRGLVARGLISRQGPRRIYQLTDRGRQVLAALGLGTAVSGQFSQQRPVGPDTAMGGRVRAHRPGRRSRQRA